MEERIKQLLEYLEETPEDPFLLFAIAKEYAIQGAPESAMRYFVRLKRMHPGYIGLYYHLAQVELELGHREEAIVTLEEGIAIARSTGEMHSASEMAGLLQSILDL